MADWVLPLHNRFWGYDELLEADRWWLDTEIEHLNTLAKRTIAEVLEVGRRLKAIQDRLANYHHGMFLDWIKAECVWSKSTVYNFINVYEHFSSFPTVGNLTIDHKALYLLAADSTPESARLEAIERAEGGEIPSGVQEGVEMTITGVDNDVTPASLLLTHRRPTQKPIHAQEKSDGTTTQLATSFDVANDCNPHP